MKKKVLIITYYWPPASGPGVQRWLKFVKFMWQSGKVEPIIYTVKSPIAPDYDDSLLNDVPKDIVIYRSSSYEPVKAYYALAGKKNAKVEVGLSEIQKPDRPIQKVAKYLRSNIFIPDAKIGWYMGNRKHILAIAQKEEVERIITTGPPHSTHLFGLYLKRKLNVDWIVDFRDPWTTIYYEKHLSRSPRSEAKNKEYEQEVVKNCDHLVVVSNGLYKEFSSIKSKIEVIYNGFDFEDIPSPSQQKSEVFSLIYTGNYKANQNIVALWKAIKKIISNPEVQEKFRFKFIGNVHASIKEEIEEFGISGNISFEKFVPHKEAVQKMVDADMLLLPIPQSEGNELILTGKIFEYLASCTEILAIGPPHGDAARILEECGRHAMIDYDDEEKLYDRISTAFNHWLVQDKASSKYDDKNYLNYSRSAMTDKYLALVH